MANSQNDVDARESLARESLRVATASDDTEAMALSLALALDPAGDVGQPDRGGRVGRVIAVARAIARELAEPGGSDSCPLQHPADGWSVRTGDRTRRGGRRDQRGARRTVGPRLHARWRPHKSTGDGATGSSPRSRRERAPRPSMSSTTGPDSSFCSRPSRGWQPRVVQHQRAAMLLGSAEHVRKVSGIEVPDAQRQQHERSIALALEAPRRQAL